MSTATQVRRPPAASRRFGYTVGVALNAALLYLVNGAPGWEAVPFLTADTSRVLVLVNLSLAAGVLVNSACVLYDARWFVSLGDVVGTAVGLVALVRVWQVFPFQLGTEPVDWAIVARVVLAFALAGSVIGIVVQTGCLLRAVRGADRTGAKGR